MNKKEKKLTGLGLIKKIINRKFSFVITFLICIISVLIPVIISKFEIEISDEAQFLLHLLLLFVAVADWFTVSFIETIYVDNEKHYDRVRENLENHINDIQKKMSNTEEQWKASYHLILSSQTKSNGGNDEAMRHLKFLKSFGLKDEDFIVDQELVFYLTSFSMHYESTYKICKEICDEMSLTLLRGDEMQSTGDIFSQIIRYIVKSSLIIVNIDGKNPNVFYELGIAHALGKNVMFISKRQNKIPFDVRQYRTVLYDKPTDLKKSLSEAIMKYKNNLLLEDKKRKEISNNKSLLDYSGFLSKRQLNEVMLLDIARGYANNQMYSEALECYHKLIELKPDSISLLIEAGRIYVMLNEFEQALCLFKRAYNKDPYDSQVLSEIEKLNLIYRSNSLKDTEHFICEYDSEMGNEI